MLLGNYETDDLFLKNKVVIKKLITYFLRNKAHENEVG